MKLLNLGTVALFGLLFPSLSEARPVGSDGKVVVAYWADWTGFSPSSIDYTKVTHVYYAFSTVGSDLNPSIPGQLSTFVSAVHSQNTQAVLSIGGWGASGYFTNVTATATSRQNFATAVNNIVKTYNLDGIDIDWEYPGEAGACGNNVSPNDSANYLLLLQLLRQTLGTKIITGAVATHPFVGTNGQPLADVSQYAKYMDWINLMTYDLGGIWGTTTAPNAPLRDGKNGGSPANCVQGVTDWSNAGFPLNQLVLGTAFYGHTMTSVSTMAQNDPSDEYVPVKGGNTGHSCSGGGFSSTADWDTIRNSYLSNATTAAAGWIRKYDPYTQTPWLFNPSTLEYISYDDPLSLQVKVNYAGCMGLKGMMLWEISTDTGELLPVLNTISSVKAGSNCLPPPGNSTSSTTTTSASSTTSTSSTKTSTKTSTSSTTTKSTSTSTTSTTSSSGGSGACTSSNNGAYECVSSGTSPKYNECVNGAWTTFSCASGTVCIQSGTSMYCGFPQ